MMTSENIGMNGASDALEKGAAQDAPLAEGESMERSAWKAPQLIDHGTVAERTGDQGLDFSYMAMS